MNADRWADLPVLHRGEEILGLFCSLFAASVATVTESHCRVLEAVPRTLWYCNVVHIKALSSAARLKGRLRMTYVRLQECGEGVGLEQKTSCARGMLQCRLVYIALVIRYVGGGFIFIAMCRLECRVYTLVSIPMAHIVFCSSVVVLPIRTNMIHSIL